MPKLEIVFTPDSFTLKDGTAVNPKPIKVEQLLNYLIFEGTTLKIYNGCHLTHEKIANELQQKLVEVYEGLKVLENSTE